MFELKGEQDKEIGSLLTNNQAPWRLEDDPDIEYVAPSTGSYRASANKSNEIIESIRLKTKTIQRYLDQYFIVTLKGDVRIGHYGTDEQGNKELKLCTWDSFKLLTKNEYFTDPTSSRPRKEYFSDLFIHDQARRQYDGLTFHFDLNRKSNYLNLWQGWGCQAQSGNIDIWLELVSTLLSNDATCIDYFTKYLAHMVQKPGELPGTAIVLRGGQGTGKNSVIDPFKKIVGRHYKYLPNQSSFLGRFNGHLMDSLLVFADESVWGGDKAAEGYLKAMITSPELPIENKGEKIIYVPNYKRMVFASNEGWAVPVGEDDRRYFVVDVSGALKGNSTFWDKYRAWMNNGGSEALFAYLQHVDLSGFDVRKVPLTEAKIDLKFRSMRQEDQFVFDLLAGYLGDYRLNNERNAVLKPHGEEVFKDELYNLYLDYLGRFNKTNRAMNTVAFWKHIYAIFGIQERQKRQGRNVYVISSLREAQDKFAKHLGNTPREMLFD